MTAINPVVTLFISHPFCLPSGNCPISRFERRKVLSALSNRMRGSVKWNIFDIEGKLPAVMKKRKDVILRTEQFDDEVLFKRVQELDKAMTSVRTVKSVTRSAYYWDWGLGATDIVIKLELKSPDGVLNLYPLAEDFEEWMFENDGYLPPGVSSWGELQKLFSEGFAGVGLQTVSWLISPRAKNYRLETCCWNILFTMGGEGGKSVFVPRETLANALVQFCGDKTTEDTFDTGVSEFFAVHQGYSGNACVVSDEVAGDSVMFLWRAVALLYGAILESTEPLYDIIAELMISPENGVSHAQNMRDVRLLIDLMLNESNPITVCSESFQEMIYSAVWDKWGGDESARVLQERSQFLAAALDDIAAQRSASLQNRLNFVVFVLTIFSVAGTIAGLVTLFDYTSPTTPLARAIILGITTGLVTLMCLVAVLSDAKRLQLVMEAVNAMFCAGRRRRSGGRMRQLEPELNAGNPSDDIVVVVGEEDEDGKKR